MVLEGGVLTQQTARRAGVTLLVGMLLGVAAIAVTSLGVLVALGVDLRGDADHAPLEGSTGLSPDELGEEQTPGPE